jgi:hypothetical protein
MINDDIKSDSIKSGRIKSDRIKTDRIKIITDPYNALSIGPQTSKKYKNCSLHVYFVKKCTLQYSPYMEQYLLEKYVHYFLLFFIICLGRKDCGYVSWFSLRSDTYKKSQDPIGSGSETMILEMEIFFNFFQGTLSVNSI